MHFHGVDGGTGKILITQEIYSFDHSFTKVRIHFLKFCLHVFFYVIVSGNFSGAESKDFVEAVEKINSPHQTLSLSRFMRAYTLDVNPFPIQNIPLNQNKPFLSSSHSSSSSFYPSGSTTSFPVFLSCVLKEGFRVVGLVSRKECMSENLDDYSPTTYKLINAVIIGVYPAYQGIVEGNWFVYF